MDELNPRGGLYPVLYNISNGKATGELGYIITLGGLADSFYEYLLKQWIQGGKTDPTTKQLYDEAIQGIFKYLLRQSTPSREFYLSSYQGGKMVDVMDHLTCFVPGMLALGSDPDFVFYDFTHLDIAKKLLETCVNMYMCSSSGIAPESVEFQESKDFVIKDPRYLLRPETIESKNFSILKNLLIIFKFKLGLFILYRKTKEVKYIHYGWRIFQSILTHCKTNSGFSGLTDVGHISDPPKDDLMQAYFLSETLKYLYLLFSEENLLSFDQYVFNTEAHPLGILSKT